MERAVAVERAVSNVVISADDFAALIRKNTILDLIENYVSNTEYIDRHTVEALLGGVKNA